MQDTLNDTRAELTNKLKDQANYWAAHQKEIRGGTKIMWNNKPITVPNGIGKMMIVLHPELYKPRSKVQWIKRSSSTKGKAIESPSTWSQLQECKKIADKRVKATSLERRRGKKGRHKSNGQEQNADILEMLSGTVFASLSGKKELASEDASQLTALRDAVKRIQTVKERTAAKESGNELEGSYTPPAAPTTSRMPGGK